MGTERLSERLCMWRLAQGMAGFSSYCYCLQGPRSEWDSQSLAPLAGMITFGQQRGRQGCQQLSEGPGNGSASVVHLLGLKAGLRPRPHLSPPSKEIIKGWYFFLGKISAESVRIIKYGNPEFY